MNKPFMIGLTLLLLTAGVVRVAMTKAIDSKNTALPKIEIAQEEKKDYESPFFGLKPEDIEKSYEDQINAAKEEQAKEAQKKNSKNKTPVTERNTTQTENPAETMPPAPTESQETPPTNEQTTPSKSPPEDFIRGY